MPLNLTVNDSYSSASIPPPVTGNDDRYCLGTAKTQKKKKTSWTNHKIKKTFLARGPHLVLYVCTLVRPAGQPCCRWTNKFFFFLINFFLIEGRNQPVIIEDLSEDSGVPIEEVFVEDGIIVGQGFGEA